jgi:hypothetical protein
MRQIIALLPGSHLNQGGVETIFSLAFKFRDSDSALVGEGSQRLSSDLGARPQVQAHFLLEVMELKASVLGTKLQR